MTEYLSAHWLDIFTTILGIIYLVLEYRASIALWIVGIIMPALDVWLYWTHGLYGDAGMAVYYTLAALYGYAAWKLGERRGGKEGEAKARPLPISHMARRLYLPVSVAFLLVWGATYFILATYTNSSIPVCDAFTNALSFVGLWALSRKYIEQWVFWIVVDAVSCYLYVSKGIPFKAFLYGLYVVVAVMGYRKWEQMMRQANDDRR